MYKKLVFTEEPNKCSVTNFGSMCYIGLDSERFCHAEPNATTIFGFLHLSEHFDLSLKSVINVTYNNEITCYILLVIHHVFLFVLPKVEYDPVVHTHILV